MICLFSFGLHSVEAFVFLVVYLFIRPELKIIIIAIMGHLFYGEFIVETPMIITVGMSKLIGLRFLSMFRAFILGFVGY